MKNNGLFAGKINDYGPYILCGFAASIGIQIGGIGSLAPKEEGTYPD